MSPPPRRLICIIRYIFHLNNSPCGRAALRTGIPGAPVRGASFKCFKRDFILQNCCLEPLYIIQYRSKYPNTEESSRYSSLYSLVWLPESRFFLFIWHAYLYNSQIRWTPLKLVIEASSHIPLHILYLILVIDHVLLSCKGSNLARNRSIFEDKLNMYPTIAVCLMKINYKWSSVLSLYGKK